MFNKNNPAFSVATDIQNIAAPSGAAFRRLLDALPAAIYTTDSDGRLTHFNPACFEFCGRTPQVGSDHWSITGQLFHRDGTRMLHDQCPMAIALKEGKVIHGAEVIAERPDGTQVWFVSYPTPLFDEAGKIVGGINMLVDISERKQAEITNSKLAAIVESSDDAIVGKDLNGIITSWNKGAEHLFGYTAEEVIGKSVTILIPPEHVNEEPAILERLRRGDRIDHYETVRRKKDGTRMDLSLTVSPVKDAQGVIIGAAKVARDITQRKQAEKALEEAHARAEAANRSKDKFLAMLSHELRTPLTPVLMTITAMDMNPELPASVRADVERIRRNIELEARLIDDLLDLSRVATGKLRLEMETVDLNATVLHVCETCKPFMLEKAIRLHCDVPGEPHFVKADSARLQQILWNLVNNALKFTAEKGEIFITVRRTGVDRIRIEVRDTGVGITADLLPSIFDAFEQGNVSTTQQFGGLGLGLAISKALVEMHGGTIKAESTGEHQGSTFTVELNAVTPTNVAAREQVPASHPRIEDGLHILLVEDHTDTALVLTLLLEAAGHNVRSAPTAAAALELADKEPFDIMLSDIGLPDATGYELMKEIDARYAIRGIAMSGYGMDEDLQKSRDAGFRDHLVKPASMAQLERSIRRVCSEL